MTNEEERKIAITILTQRRDALIAAVETLEHIFDEDSKGLTICDLAEADFVVGHLEYLSKIAKTADWLRSLIRSIESHINEWRRRE